MDDRSFDTFARSLANGRSSRRTTIKGLGAALLAGLLGRSGFEAAAACGEVDDHCGGRRRCCPGARCRLGRCRCRKAFRNCDGRCRNVKTDPKHCGRCDRRCRRNQGCVKGRCVRGVGGGPDDGAGIEVGKPCDRNRPEECASGNCGCEHGPNARCFCRVRQCHERYQGCGRAEDCCEGRCAFGVTPDGTAGVICK